MSIALEEIAADKIVVTYPGDAQAQAEAILGAGEEAEPGVEGGDAEVVSLETPATEAGAGDEDA